MAHETDIPAIIVEAAYEGTIGRLDKWWWWKDWLRPLIFYSIPFIPLIYITGWYLGYF
ncbi:MAG: hypothetical protein ACKVI6_06555 [Candidatus Poseidoniales archaeon]|jgi:hypothetical protein|tara:strand:+ start:471 stop:644 length:174 start_codon:yes stop_codon:yes gene_type:complete